MFKDVIENVRELGESIVDGIITNWKTDNVSNTGNAIGDAISELLYDVTKTLGGELMDKTTEKIYQWITPTQYTLGAPHENKFETHTNLPIVDEIHSKDGTTTKHSTDISPDQFKNVEDFITNSYNTSSNNETNWTDSIYNNGSYAANSYNSANYSYDYSSYIGDAAIVNSIVNSFNSYGSEYILSNMLNSHETSGFSFNFEPQLLIYGGVSKYGKS